MIRIQSLTMRFGRTVAVDGASISIAPGESVALWGSNGAGKTTILRCVLGLFRYQGTITVGGLDARRNGKHTRRLIGYVPQELGFNEDLSVGESLAFFARLKGIPSPSIVDVLRRVGLPGQDRKRMRELSGGMKQRLALAIALLGDPPILILDEVTASLDACGREELVSLLSALRAAGKSMLFASHRVEEVTALASRVVILDQGRVVRETPASEFGSHPGADIILHLIMDAGARERAMPLLRAGGFEPRLNGAGLLVPVRGVRKAEPLRILAQGSVAVDDFDIVQPPIAIGLEHKEATA